MDERRGRRFSIFALFVIVLVVAVFIYAGQRQGWFSQAAKTAVMGAETNQPGLYPIVKFVDGDTIDVDMDGHTETVRFLGVDTPETHKPDTAVQCFGEKAAAFTKQTIGSSGVRLEADPTNQNRDRYGRLLRYVYLPNGTDVDAEIIKQGYGFAYILFPFQKMSEYQQYETQAKDAGKGLWSGCQVHSEGQKEQTNPA